MKNFHYSKLNIALLACLSSSVAFAEDIAAQDAPKVHQLETIVVTASGYEQKITDAPASITVITAEDFKTKRITSVADALSDVEGVDISPTAGKTGGLNIRIRGMDSEYTLVLIDGRRQNSTGDITPNGFGESNNSFIPPVSAIERIEIIRGPASTLYGSDAIGGVVNIITKKVAEEWSGSVTLEGTVLPNSSDFGNQRAIDTYLTGPLVDNLLGLQLRGRYTERDQSTVTRPNEDGSETELSMGNNPTKSDLQTIGARLTLTPTQDHDLSLDIENTEQWYDNKNGQLGTLGANGGYGEAKEYNRDKYVIAHTWRNQIGTLESSITRNETETLGRLIPARAQGMASTITPRLLESEDTIFDTKLSTQAIENHNITVGGQWWEASIKDGLRQKQEVDFRQFGLFAEDTWALNEQLALTLGLRYDDHDTFGDFWTPRAYLVWNANDNWTFKGGYSEGYKAPRLERLTNGLVNVGGQGRSPSFGNPNLKPETSQNLEIGTYFSNNDNFDFNVTAFFSKIEDKIVNGNATLRCNTDTNKQECEQFMASVGTPWVMDYNPRDGKPDTWNVARPVNAEEAEIYGIEAGANWDLTPDLKLGINYTWTETELKDESLGNPKFNDTPEHIANATLKWQAADNAQLWLRSEFRSERARYTSTYENLTDTEKKVSDTMGDFKAYTLFHVGTNINLTNNWDLGVALYNVFDKNFVDYEFIDGGAYNNYSNTQEGRRVQLNTTFKF